MSTLILPGPYGEMRRATAAGGASLTTTPQVIPFPKGTRQVRLVPRNFSTAVVAQVALVPYLAVLKTADNLATITDYSDAAQDGDAATDVVLSSLDTAANQDYLYVGSHLPFRGAIVDVDAANGNASTLTVKYRKTDDTWTDISATDGTTSGGASMAIDGTVTWTVPTDWKKTSLREVNSPAPAAGLAYSGDKLYWTRWQFSAALDSSTTLNSLMALARSTNYWEIASGFDERFETRFGLGGWCGIEARTDAGTANLLLNVAAQHGEVGFAS